MSPARGAGRIDKREAVMAAAFAVFAREGYPQATVDQIAAEAGVAKATIYNHFGDKETMFREAIAALSDNALARNIAAVSRLSAPGPQLKGALEELGIHLIDCYCDEQACALRRLLYAEAPRFPDLLELVHDRVQAPVLQTLADRLARLSVAGRLTTSDPVTAAEQFTALLTGPLESRARFGIRRVPRAERKVIAATAATTFLHAFAGPVE